MRNPTLINRRAQASINMTPMIDVTFLLIIFFLVSSHLSKQENHVKLNLPVAEHALSADIVAAEQSVTLNLMDNGQLRLGAADVPRADLVALLMEKNASNAGKLQVRIRCSQETPYSRVAPLLGDLVRAQITDVVFAVYEGQMETNVP